MKCQVYGRLTGIMKFRHRWLKPGVNTISVRVLDTQGGGGIYGAPEKMKLSLKSDPNLFIPLKGDWKYQPVAELTGNKFYIFDITKNEFLTRKRPANAWSLHSISFV